jgi:hypothetical protein
LDSKEDIRQWFGLSLSKLPESLSSAYITFILEYTFRVLQNKSNWSNIVAVALALIDEDTLSYERVLEVIKKDKKNPVVK